MNMQPNYLEFTEEGDRLIDPKEKEHFQLYVQTVTLPSEVHNNMYREASLAYTIENKSLPDDWFGDHEAHITGLTAVLRWAFSCSPEYQLLLKKCLEKHPPTPQLEPIDHSNCGIEVENK